MASSFLQGFIITLLAIVLTLSFYIKSKKSKSSLLPVDWPILGMLPTLVSNLHSLHESLNDVLATSCCSFLAQLASGMRFFVTCDPANIQHIFTANHANYPKGEEFGEIFEILQGGFFTVDGESWRRQRGKIKTILSNPRMVSLMSRCSQEKLARGLVPFLTRMANTRTAFDLQDLINRLAFDSTAMLIFSVDPGLLSPEMPPMDGAVAMDTVMVFALIRHAMPASCWKLMRRLNIGPEKKLAAAHSKLRGFVMEMMEKRKANNLYKEQDTVDILSSYIHDPEFNDDLLRTTLITYMVAGRDTIGTSLPWFFYNIAKNPHVVSAIRKELEPIVSRRQHAAAVSNDSGMVVLFEPEDTKALVYLQAALFESLRLHPPGPIERKTVLRDDVMPSGHEVCSGDTVLISLYALGRMESVWGKDCREYRPERWLSNDGLKLRYVPSHKFLAFNSGPRTCPGKDIAIMQMKTVAAAVLWNFDMEVLEGQSVDPKLSCLLQMKDGLMVMVNKREKKGFDYTK